MKKIMFNDDYGLTEAVIQGRKTVTRRIIPQKLVDQYKLPCWQVTYKSIREWLLANSTYKVGEVIAIAQAYKDINERGIVQFKPTSEPDGMIYGDNMCQAIWAENHAGWNNKMFVKAELMPHHIKITNIRVERLQNISDEDCLREGIYIDKKGGQSIGYPLAVPFYCTFRGAINRDGKQLYWSTLKDAFTALIDKVSGNGTWDSNPLVWVYEFELINSKE